MTIDSAWYTADWWTAVSTTMSSVPSGISIVAVVRATTIHRATLAAISFSATSIDGYEPSVNAPRFAR